MAAKRAVLSLLALLAVACDVEEPTFDVDAGDPDAGVVADAGVDAGVAEDCILDPSVCAATEFCGPDATCEARDRTCAATSECGPLDVCARPLVPTSTLADPGRCEPTPGGCATDADCADGVCLGVGVCGPRAARATLAATTLVPRAACSTHADCGVAGVCRAGICDACLVHADCAGNLLCSAGACVEAANCSDTVDFSDCFEGNICDGGGACQRATDACVPDPENDTLGTALPIEDGSYDGLSICGDEADWYALRVPEGSGVQVVLTSSAAQMTANVSLQDADGAILEGLSRLALPGLTVLRLPSGAARELLMQVWSSDASGDYAFSVRYEAGQCGDDPLELYGADLEIPTNVVFEGRMCPGVEERRTFAAGAGDELQARLEMLDVEAPGARLALLDAADTELDASAVAGAVVTATAAVRGAGTYAFVATADRLASLGSPYRMRLVRKLSGREGACQAPTRLDPASGPLTVRGDLSGAVDLGRPDCTELSDTVVFAESARQDLLYAVAAPSQYSLLQVSVVPVSGTDPQLSVALLSTCDSDTSATACEAAVFPNSQVGLQVVVSPGEQPTLVVSSDGPAEDVIFDLHLEYVSLATFENDRCVDATPLTVTGTRAVVLYGGPVETPWGARNDDTLWSNLVSPRCATYADDGRGVDRYYSLSLDPGEMAAVELSGPLYGMLWTGLNCTDMPATCLQAEVRDFEHPVLRATFTASISGTEHWIVVDGQEAEDQGRYVLRTIRHAQCLEDTDCEDTDFNVCGSSPCRCDDYVCATAPANDRCPGEAITLDADGRARVPVRVEGDRLTGAATDDLSLECTGTAEPDVVYAVTVPAGATELVARIVDATFDPALEIRRSGCADGAFSSSVCNDDARYPDVVLPEARVREPAAAIYYIVVDSYAGRGAFDLEIEVR